MNKIQKIMGLIGVLGMSTPMIAGDFRAPLCLEGYPWHLASVEDAWWYDMMPEHRGERFEDWHIRKHLTLYGRSAGNAFGKSDRHSSDCCDDNSDKNTRHTESLAALFFGKSEFRGEEAFTNGIITDPLLLAKTNPFLGSAFIKPQYEYDERGLAAGLCIDYVCGEERTFHVGASFHLPFKIVEVQTNFNVDQEETLEDLVDTSTITQGPAGDIEDIAIRLDLLRSLAINETTPLLNQVGPNLDLGDILVDSTTANDNLNVPAVYVVRRLNGEAGAAPFRKQPQDVTGALAADGLNGNDGQVFFFKTGTNYAAGTSALFGNRQAQGTLFVVPRANNANADINTLPLSAQAVVTRIIDTLQNADLADRTASDFFEDQGIDIFSYERKVGLGDLDADVYFKYCGDESPWFGKVSAGVKFPTGTKKKCEDTLHVLQLQTGNNRHWELCVKFAAGWMPWDWVGFDIGGSAHHAFSRHDEKMSAAFKGATVKNLGPEVEGKVSWSYFTAHANFNFVHPWNPGIGMMIGYQLFAKTKDKISYDVSIAKDFLDRATQPLDPEVAEEHTKAMLHKVRAEMFHSWNFFEIFVGGSHAFAGRNAMKETEGHVGLAVYF